MSGEYLGYSKGFVANTALAVNRFVVTHSTRGRVAYAAAANPLNSIGVTDEAADTALDHVSIAMAGIRYVSAAAAITIGDRVYISNATGQISTIPDNATDQAYEDVGVALTAAAAANDVILVLLNNPSNYRSR